MLSICVCIYISTKMTTVNILLLLLLSDIVLLHILKLLTHIYHIFSPIEDNTCNECSLKTWRKTLHTKMNIKHVRALLNA
jgi:hypothetical protein